MTSDSLTIIGSIYKMVIDQRVRLLKRLIVLLISLPLSCIKEGTFLTLLPPPSSSVPNVLNNFFEKLVAPRMLPGIHIRQEITWST